MKALFEAITTVERWLRQRYPRGARVFWNQIMVILGTIMLKQEGITITVGNLERYTPISSSSIHRTVETLKEYEVIEMVGEENYDFKGDVPTDIMELSTNKAAIEINGVLSDLKETIKSGVAEALHGLNLREEEIIQVTERIDKIQPKKKKLSALAELVGDGFM